MFVWLLVTRRALSTRNQSFRFPDARNGAQPRLSDTESRTSGRMSCERRSERPAFRLPARQRINQKVELVDEVVLQQGVDELAAAVRYDRPAWLRLQCAYRLDHVVADDRRVAPDRLVERARNHVFLGRIHHVAK